MRRCGGWASIGFAFFNPIIYQSRPSPPCHSLDHDEKRRAGGGRIRLDSTDRKIMRLFKGRKFSFARESEKNRFSHFVESHFPLPLPVLVVDEFIRIYWRGEVTLNLLICKHILNEFLKRISKLLSRFKRMESDLFRRVILAKLNDTDRCHGNAISQKKQNLSAHFSLYRFSSALREELWLLNRPCTVTLIYIKFEYIERIYKVIKILRIPLLNDRSIFPFFRGAKLDLRKERRLSFTFVKIERRV